MAKRTRWKMVAAVLAVVIAGIVYCTFFAEEKEDKVQYRTGEEAAGTVDNMSSRDVGSNDAQMGSNMQQLPAGQNAEVTRNSGTGQDSEESQSNERGRNPGSEGTDVQGNGSVFICVHICGAVKQPAVYSLPEGSRVCDAIAKAGGLTETAADDYVNQARFLTDGERVYIPKKDELGSLSASQYAAGQLVVNMGGSQEERGGQGSQEQKPVNINTATLGELTTLPGIGESRAESIITYREKHGAFARIEDIMKISGIKGAAYEKIKDRICTGNE